MACHYPLTTCPFAETRFIWRIWSSKWLKEQGFQQIYRIAYRHYEDTSETVIMRCDISLEYLGLPKGIITQQGDGTYEVDVDALLDFHTSNPGKKHFHDMEEKLYDTPITQYNKGKDMLGEKWVNAKTGKDRYKIMEAEEEADLWFIEQCRGIDAGIKEIKRTYDELIKWAIEHSEGCHTLTTEPEITGTT